MSKRTTRPLVQHEILVVEDDADLRSAICSVLETEGCVTADAESGEAALAMLGRGLEPCLVLLDIEMPGMPARDFLTQARAQPAGARVPVVVLTGLSDPLPSLAVDRVLRKPFDLKTLFGIVYQHCDCNLRHRSRPRPHQKKGPPRGGPSAAARRLTEAGEATHCARGSQRRGAERQARS